MFATHNINNHDISIKNLILLFLTIVFGFGSVITLAQLSIPSDINNARQTIAKITINANGDDAPALLEFSAQGIYIASGVLQEQTTFSGKVLGIDDNGNLIYTTSQGLVVSGAGAGGGGLWDVAGDDVYRYTGNVGIGTSTMSGKLHIINSGSTDVYIQETNPANAANINFQTTQQRWMIGGFNTKFYIGLSGDSFIDITTGGFVGIGTTSPKAPLQVNGNIIAGYEGNIITNSDNSAIVGGGGQSEINNISGSNRSFIAGGKANTITDSEASAIIGGVKNNTITNSPGGFILGGIGNTINNASYSTIAGGNGNHIYTGENTFIGGGDGNTIENSLTATINGGLTNTIRNSSKSIILGGKENTITNADYSLSAGYKTQNSGYNNTFVRNSSSTTGFSAAKAASFLINVPGGMGINTPNPQAALDVSGDIRANNITITNTISAKSIQLSGSNTNCRTTNDAGKIIYSGGNFYGCVGVDGRKQLNN